MSYGRFSPETPCPKPYALCQIFEEPVANYSTRTLSLNYPDLAAHPSILRARASHNYPRFGVCRFRVDVGCRVWVQDEVTMKDTAEWPE